MPWACSRCTRLTRAKVQIELVARAAVDKQQPQRAQRVDVTLDQLDGVPGQPARPNILADRAGVQVERQRQAQRSTWLGRVAGRHRQNIQHVDIGAALLGPGIEGLPPGISAHQLR